MRTGFADGSVVGDQHRWLSPAILLDQLLVLGLTKSHARACGSEEIRPLGTSTSFCRDGVLSFPSPSQALAMLFSANTPSVKS